VIGDVRFVILALPCPIFNLSRNLYVLPRCTRLEGNRHRTDYRYMGYKPYVVAGLVALTVIGRGDRLAAQRDAIGPRELPTAHSVRTDYVCDVQLLPPGIDPTAGEFGHLSITFHTSPDCKGARVGTARIFSRGATASDSVPTYLVSEAMLHTYFLMLQRAAGTGQLVSWSACEQFTKTSCLRFVGAQGIDSSSR
jgi:hypothetical protein